MNKYVFLVFAFLCSCKPSVVHISKKAGFKVTWSSCLLPNDDGEFYVIPRRGRSSEAWDSLMRRYCREDSMKCSAFYECANVIDPYSFFVQDQNDAAQNRTWKRFSASLPEGTGVLNSDVSKLMRSPGKNPILFPMYEWNLQWFGIALNSETKKRLSDLRKFLESSIVRLKVII